MSRVKYNRKVRPQNNYHDHYRRCGHNPRLSAIGKQTQKSKALVARTIRAFVGKPTRLLTSIFGKRISPQSPKKGKAHQ